MIDEHFEDLEAVTSTKQACALLGASRATRYRRRRPPVAGPPPPRPTPPNALSEAERQRILAVLRSAEYCDLAPAQVWARLLDDGIYLCSIRTMYRLLAVAGENRERRRQRTHPAKKKPELIARRPNEVWSWDITKLQGPTRGTYYELFVIIAGVLSSWSRLVSFSRWLELAVVVCQDLDGVGGHRHAARFLRRFLVRCSCRSRSRAVWMSRTLMRRPVWRSSRSMRGGRRR